VEDEPHVVVEARPRGAAEDAPLGEREVEGLQDRPQEEGADAHEQREHEEPRPGAVPPAGLGLRPAAPGGASGTEACGGGAHHSLARASFICCASSAVTSATGRAPEKASGSSSASKAFHAAEFFDTGSGTA